MAQLLSNLNESFSSALPAQKRYSRCIVTKSRNVGLYFFRIVTCSSI